jgi:tetratricopeptide (TPR) repeat protein
MRRFENTTAARTARNGKLTGIDTLPFILRGDVARRRWRLIAVTVAATTAVLVLLARSAPVVEAIYEWQLRRALASRAYRVVAGRLSGSPYAPLSAKRGDHDAYDNITVLAATSRIVGRKTSPHLRGKALLLQGRTEAAIEQLRVASATGDAAALSDLAAALSAEAEELDAYEPAIDAVVAARRAIAAAPARASAYFNLALALDRLGLTREARRAFESAASLEPASGWAEEALSRADSLRREGMPSNWSTTERLLIDTSDPTTRRALILSDAHLARVHAEGPYLTEWAEKRIERKTEEARAVLELARTIGTVLQQVSGERLALDAVTAVDRAEGRGEDTALALARAHLAYMEGRLARRDHDMASAIVHLSKAAQDLTRLGSPLQHLARYYIAGALYEQGRIDDALAVLDSLDENVLETSGYRGLAAQTGWERGICLVVRGSYAEALDVFRRSRAKSVAIGEHDLTARFDGLAAEALEYLGQPREAWAHRARALRAYAMSGRIDSRKAVGLTSAAQLQIAAGQWERAAALLDYAVPLAEQADDPFVATHALTQRSVAFDELREHDRAARDLREAGQWLRRIKEPASRERMDVEIDIAEGVAKRGASAQKALVHFTRAIEQLRRGGHTSLLPRLHYERARTHEILGDADRQRDDLRAGLEVIARWESSIGDREQRAAMSTWSDAIRRDLIALELASGDVGAAFSYADHRLTAADLHEPVPLPRPSLTAVQSELAPHAAIIEFVEIRGRLIAFILRGDVARAVRLPASSVRITAAAESMRRADDATLPARATELHDLLVAPILDHLESVTTLAIVPEQELSGIPFGALRDARTGRYLIERFVVFHAPSARSALFWSHRARDVQSEVEAVLSIGASEFDRTRYIGVEPLPAVAGEAREIALLSRSARVLSGDAATSEAVQREIAEATVIHYAGHIIGRGSEARLLLAPALGRDSLSAREISRLKLPKTRVAVLAACRGGAGSSEPHAIIADMASGFLAAGVPTVIASATDITDAEAPATMLRLHSLLKDGDDAADAVHRLASLDRQKGKAVPLSIRLLVLGGSHSLVRQR